MFSLKENSNNWAWAAAEELSLFKTYVETQEEYTRTVYLDYQKRATENRIRFDGGVDIIREVDGLADDTWNLSLIYESYFPNLQRKSQLVTLCIYIEDQMSNLCGHQKREKNLRLQPGDLGTQGLSKEFTYLTRVAGLKISHRSKPYKHIHRMRQARNSIVHDNGRIQAHRKSLVQFAREQQISRAGELIVSPEFMRRSIEMTRRWIGIIGQAIERDT